MPALCFFCDVRPEAIALALGAKGIHCGTAFLATRESFAHDYHKRHVVDPGAEDTAVTDACVRNWPAGAPGRVTRNSVIEGPGHHLTGHDPDEVTRETVATRDGRPVLRFSTDWPLRGTAGNLGAMALCAGQSAAFVERI